MLSKRHAAADFPCQKGGTFSARGVHARTPSRRNTATALILRVFRTGAPQHLPQPWRNSTERAKEQRRVRGESNAGAAFARGTWLGAETQARSDHTQPQSANCPLTLTEPRARKRRWQGYVPLCEARSGMTEKAARRTAKCSLGVWASPSTSCAAGTPAASRCKYHRTTARSSRRSHHPRAHTIGWSRNWAVDGPTLGKGADRRASGVTCPENAVMSARNAYQGNYLRLQSSELGRVRRHGAHSRPKPHRAGW